MRNKKKKIEKTRAKEKQSHAQDNIYMVRQLSVSTELQGFHYYQGRIQSTTCGYNIFSHTKTRQQHPKTLITKVGFTMS